MAIELPLLTLYFDARSISSRMSLARQAVILSDNLTPAGYRPSFTPAHQCERDTGKTANTVGRRTRPVAGRFADVVGLFWSFMDGILFDWMASTLTQSVQNRGDIIARSSTGAGFRGINF